jgi:hypothetical protein
MSQPFVIIDIEQVLKSRLFPAVTMWNRLEGRPRTHNFDRALKAEVRDALWMITRQWGMGEFKGSDNGSPIFAKLHLSTTRLTQYFPGQQAAEAFDDSTPLEAKVERRPIPFVLEMQDTALDLRLIMGRQWLKMLKTVTANQADHDAYITQYKIEAPDPNDANDATRCAHPDVWATFAAVAGKRMDGAKLYLYLEGDTSRLATDGITLSNPVQKGDIDALGKKFMGWFQKLYFQPPASDQDAWLPDRLEYQFAVSTPTGNGEKVLTAEEYYHGRLDWYNFDIDAQSSGLGVAGSADPRGSTTQTFIPMPIVFEGMPNTRWWTFEDRRTNFGDIKPDTTDISKLLVMEFGLVYGNDWFLLPYRLLTGTVAKIEGMAVTNVFGERIWIEAAGSGQDDTWQRWSMFTLNTKGKLGERADTTLLLLPTVPKIQEGKPREEVMFIRDEMANMIWGIEKIVPVASGVSKPGAEAAVELFKFLQMPLNTKVAQMQARRIELESIPEAERTQTEQDELSQIISKLAEILPPEPKANIRYQIMNTVPEHWIPFIPVQMENDNRQIQLQRAAMPRILTGDENAPKRVRPRTALLRHGLDQTPRTSYFLHEEEVPRAGVIVRQSFQRTRWLNGGTWVWLGAQKQTGRGGGQSGLQFDALSDVKK